MLVSRPILPGLRDIRRVEVKSSPHGDQQGSMRMRKLLMAGVALGFGLAMTAPAALADIQIAAAGPMTGQYASFGEQLKRGAEMAVEELNAAGGVNGEKLVLNVGDDACDPKQRSEERRVGKEGRSRW